jgi:hypothetical protein
MYYTNRYSLNTSANLEAYMDKTLKQQFEKPLIVVLLNSTEKVDGDALMNNSPLTNIRYLKNQRNEIT